jgi:competence protein ComEA
MGNRRPSQEHQEAVSRRLALLSSELEGVRGRLADPTVARRDARDDEFAMPLTHTRVRARPSAEPAPEPAPDPAPGPDPVPAPLIAPPGRHASRRPARSIADALPPTLRGRVALGPAQLAFVAALVAVGLAVTCWWVIRGDAREVATPALSSPAGGLATPAVPVASESATADAAAADGTVTVDVTGRVRRPGIAVLDAGARVIDALKAAGGTRPGVDLASLNLARLLVDGEQIVVGAAAPTGVAGATAAPIPPAATTGPLVNINTADQTLLETLPDVGPVTAEAIIAWRTEHGGFTAIDELLEVDGIGDATLATLTPHVTV